MSLDSVLFNQPIRTLVLSFLAWKSLLLVIAIASPGSGYDTSASLTQFSPTSAGQLPAPLGQLVDKLMKWDAIYFVKVANRGYVFEQEWVWGRGFTQIIAFFTAAIGGLGVPKYEGLEAVVGIAIVHVAHFLSVLVIFALGGILFPSLTSKFALTAALLHIISPAGIFLSAPYAESSCALLSFSGIYLFAKSLTLSGQSTARHDLLILLSGITFGLAATFRSNGIFNGLLLLEEAFRVLVSLRNGVRFDRIRRLLTTGLGGVCVGAGFIIPQYIAWNEYCSGSDVTQLRPWCRETIPSIYTFAQEHYWNVGLFRYWTLSNLPLFLLAAPMFTLMTVSGFWGLNYKKNNDSRSSKLQAKAEKKSRQEFDILRNLAISQLLLTLLTLTTAHVQIITRISSAYPVLLWYLAAQLQGGNSKAEKVVRFMIIYGIIQAGLFASFLPPA